MANSFHIWNDFDPNVGAVYDRPQYGGLQASTLWTVIDRPFYVVPACQPPTFCVVRDSLSLFRSEERQLLIIEFCSRSEDNVNDAQRGTSKRRVAVLDH